MTAINCHTDFSTGLMIILGTCIQATANNLDQFIAGRFVLGFGVSTSSTAGPSYVAEIAHPVYRGTLTAIYNSFWFIGCTYFVL